MNESCFQIFINPEDTLLHKVKLSTNEKVERVRRAHLNDLENILIFFMAAFAFCLTNPSFSWANFLFKTYTISRIAHTIVYAVVPVPQPARAIAWFIGYFITGYMALTSILYFAA
ncbi:hypothetical protein HHI36_003273 [Cryptolaemus montrouzieri]|uniref:Microsomal glutathione S-transferase 1 n=1 Tax=Cryptolaemus montrouzieri TaxID=559131 RepID=A0ABD2PD58_9CUCU